MVALFVALLFVGLVLTDLFVEKFKVWQAARARAITVAWSVAAPWEVPETVHLSDVHTWTRPDPAGGLQVGADSLVTYVLGAAQRIIMPAPGEDVTAGQELFRLERNGHSLTVPSTLTGKVVSVNSQLLEKPGLLNSDPYGRGWVCQIAPTSLAWDPPAVRDGSKAMAWLEREFDRLGRFLSTRIPAQVAVGATSQDGGLPASGCLGELDAAAWKAFETEFLARKA